MAASADQSDEVQKPRAAFLPEKAVGDGCGDMTCAELHDVAAELAGTPRWLYMYVDLGSGTESVTCQVVGASGRATTIGSFRLADGYGAWGSPDPGDVGPLSGARLVSDNGTVLATATFPR